MNYALGSLVKARGREWVAESIKVLKRMNCIGLVQNV